MKAKTPLISEQKMKRIVADLSSRDKRLAKVISEHQLCTIGRNPKPVTHFESLIESVISQQLAVKAADTIYGRVKKLAGGQVLEIEIADLLQLPTCSALAPADHRRITAKSCTFMKKPPGSLRLRVS